MIEYGPELTADDLRVLGELRDYAPGATFRLAITETWVMALLRWPGGDMAEVAVFRRTGQVHPVGERGDVSDDAIATAAITSLRRPLELGRRARLDAWEAAR